MCTLRNLVALPLKESFSNSLSIAPADWVFFLHTPQNARERFTSFRVKQAHVYFLLLTQAISDLRHLFLMYNAAA